MTKKLKWIGIGMFAALHLNFAYSAEPKVEISSFYFAGQRTSAAEVCGKVSDLPVPQAVVRVVVDEDSKTPGIYHTPVEQDGAFCLTVVTQEGTASASVKVASRLIQSSRARITTSR